MAAWAARCLDSTPFWQALISPDRLQSWRAITTNGYVDLQVPDSDRSLARTVRAHRSAVRALPEAHRPRLLAVEPRHRALLLTIPRGQRADRGEYSAEPRVYRNAGSVLHTWHQHATTLPAAHEESAQYARQYADRIDRIICKHATGISPAATGAIEASLTLLRQHASSLPAAYGHGAFGPRAWLCTNTYRVTLTCYGQARPMPAAFDFARPALFWTENPALASAFTIGYRRRPTPDEAHLVPALTVLASFDDLHQVSKTEDADCSYAAKHLDLAIEQFNRSSHMSTSVDTPSSYDSHTTLRDATA
ncbi:hypothetical protein ABZW47_29385 [Streptomyces sp. NPDC004549]|uniref:hypothetical protein n=1 Tax=Streptomyces sp. NPDC004549 TaxID=3154283 RepID=UPI0033BD948B